LRTTAEAQERQPAKFQEKTPHGHTTIGLSAPSMLMHTPVM
jgi:hypothetical protein